MKKKDSISLINEDFKLITGAMPVIDEDNKKRTRAAITKRIRATFNLNRDMLEAQHEERHKEFLELAGRTGGKIRWQTAYQTFKKTVVDLIKKGEKNINTAIKMTFNTTWFTPEAVRGRQNIWKVLRSDKELFKQLRRYAGWKEKMSVDNLSWDEEGKFYWYRGSNYWVSIEIINSPKGGYGKIIRLTRHYDNGVTESTDFQYDAEGWETVATEYKNSRKRDPLY